MCRSRDHHQGVARRYDWTVTCVDSHDNRAPAWTQSSDRLNRLGLQLVSHLCRGVPAMR